MYARYQKTTKAEDGSFIVEEFIDILDDKEKLIQTLLSKFKTDDFRALSNLMPSSKNST